MWSLALRVRLAQDQAEGSSLPTARRMRRQQHDRVEGHARQWSRMRMGREVDGSYLVPVRLHLTRQLWHGGERVHGSRQGNGRGKMLATDNTQQVRSTAVVWRSVIFRGTKTLQATRHNCLSGPKEDGEGGKRVRLPKVRRSYASDVAQWTEWSTNEWTNQHRLGRAYSAGCLHAPPA